MHSIQPVIKAVLNKDELADCGLSELQSLAKQYPYFAPVHLLLAEKIRSMDENLYKEQLEKVSLYIQNPLWLHYLLHEGSFQKKTIASNPPGDGQERMDDSHIQVPIQDTTTDDVSSLDQPPVAAVDQQPGNGSSMNVLAEAPKPTELEETENSGQGNDEPTTEPEHFSIPAPGEDHEEDDGTAGHAELKIPALKIEPLSQTKNDLLFEPYHTVDYFASQGIRHTGEDKPRDKFGMQLKSFTDWLKTMKKLPANEVEQQMDKGSETKVQSLADSSISQNEIVTEAMAEVWLKQGDIARAREVYQKLSLQNPSKSHYFAAKIESLKTN